MPIDLKKTWDACGEAFHRYTTAENSLSRAIEGPAIESMLGDCSGLRLLDLGCGSGVYTLKFAERGANVVGIDISSKMIELARSEAARKKIAAEFKVGDISKPLQFQDGDFDLVFSSTALHYVASLETTFREVSRTMKRGGRFLASVLHPISTSRFPVASEDAEAPRWTSRNTWQIRYHDGRDRIIETPWLGCGVVGAEGQRLRCHHHSIHEYFKALQTAGLRLIDLSEPAPSEDLALANPEIFEEAVYVPLYLVFCATRPA
jgi:SAM-dependent methyltransferase